MISTFNALSRELRRRVMLMVGRAVLTVVDDSTGLQTVQVEGLRDEVIDGAEKFGMYGITSHPLKGADALVFSVGGMRQHSIIFIDDRRHRVTELAEGEVCLYSHLDEEGNLHRVLLNKDRGVEVHGVDVVVHASGDYTINCDGDATINAGGDATIDAGGSVTVDSGGSITLDSSGDTLTVQ